MKNAWFKAALARAEAAMAVIGKPPEVMIALQLKTCGVCHQAKCACVASRPA
jgi:hypothetical protein